MGDLLKLIWYAVTGLLRSRAALQTEILVLRHQLNVLRRRAPKRVACEGVHRRAYDVLKYLSIKLAISSENRLSDAPAMRAVLFSAWKLPDPMYGYSSIPTHIEKCLASALLRSSGAGRASQAFQAVWLGEVEAPDEAAAVEKGRGGIQGAGQQTDGDTAMIRRKGEITRVSTRHLHHPI
jgi:hypothetical protein